MKKKLVIFMVAIFMLSFSLSPMEYASATENMKEYYVIDDNGYIVDVYYLIKQDGVDYSHYIDIEPTGLIKPRWDGTKWVETYVAPTPTPTPMVIPDSPENEIVNKPTTATINKTLTATTSNSEDLDSGAYLTTNSITIKTGKNYDIDLEDKEENSTCTWTSSNEKVATVSKSGKVKGIKKGKAVISCTITTSDNTIIILKCKVKVK